MILSSGTNNDEEQALKLADTASDNSSTKAKSHGLLVLIHRKRQSAFLANQDWQNLSVPLAHTLTVMTHAVMKPFIPLYGNTTKEHLKSTEAY